MALTFRGGVSIPQDKSTAIKETRIFDTPDTVYIPISESGVPTVKEGDRVDIGQVIAASDKHCSVHASVSGTVIAADEKKIRIANDFENRLSRDIKPYDGSFEDLELKDIVDTLRRAGIPIYEIIEASSGRVDTLIVNCVESQPYLTAVYSLLAEESDAVIGGMKILLKALGLRVGDIAIAENKPDIIRLIRRKLGDGGYADIKTVSSRYPQSDERQLVYAVVGKEIPLGKSPVDMGCAVVDARDCADVYNAFVYGMPLINRSVAVCGDLIKEPACVRCPIGTSFGELIDFCGGTEKKTENIINGGPMNGQRVSDTDTPVTKDTVALLAVSDNSYRQSAACIRCGRCVSVCPMKLLPNYLAAFAGEGKYDLCEKYDVMSCIECGVCSYVCPGNMPISALCREAKENIIEKGGTDNEG